MKARYPGISVKRIHLGRRVEVIAIRRLPLSPSPTSVPLSPCLLSGAREIQLQVKVTTMSTVLLEHSLLKLVPPSSGVLASRRPNEVKETEKTKRSKGEDKRNGENFTRYFAAIPCTECPLSYSTQLTVLHRVLRLQRYHVPGCKNFDTASFVRQLF